MARLPTSRSREAQRAPDDGEPQSAAVPSKRARSNHKGEAVRRSVLETAADLFAERGFGGTSFTDIADALGMSRPGLYHHFSSKELLLEALVKEVTLSGVEAQTAERWTEIDPSDALHKLVRRSCEWQAQHGRMFRVLDRSEGELPGELLKRHEEGKRAYLRHMVELIDHGVKVGRFRPVDATIAAFGIIGMCNWMAWWYRPDGRVSVDEVIDTLADAAVRTVLRVDSHRSRSEHVGDLLRILREDVSHLERVLKD